MVKVVLAAGAGNVGSTILDALVAKGNHEVIIFARKDVPNLTSQGVKVVKVEYTDKARLIQELAGVDTVLSFVANHLDPDNIAQRTLIDACIEAGVRRFAPSEWATRSNSGIAEYILKDQVHKYLEEVNQEKPILEYTLFQPGLFLNYFSYPHPSAKHLTLFPMPIDVAGCRAIILRDTKAQITLTSIEDVARVVAEAIDYEGRWPEISGIRGNQIPVTDFIKICEKVRGRPFSIEEVEKKDLEEGEIIATWFPRFVHPAIPEDVRDAFSQKYFAGFLLALENGSWNVSDEWNERLPDYQFTKCEEFLRGIWEGIP